MSDVTIPEKVLGDWHEREPKWRVRIVDYTVEPVEEDSGPIVLTRPSKVATIGVALTRDRDGLPPETQHVTTSGYVMIADPPTLLLAFPLEET